MADDKDEEFLSQEEVMSIIKNLEAKYGDEIKTMLDNITNDVKKYGHLTHETKKARKALKNKILSEREIKDEPSTH